MTKSKPSSARWDLRRSAVDVARRESPQPLGMPPALLAARRFARSRLDRRSRSALRLREISSASASPRSSLSARLPHAEAEDRLRERLIGLGYREIVSIPLVNAEEDALFRAEGVEPARVGNPLAEDASLLRSTGLVSMAHALAWNLNRGQRNVRLFEIGRAYTMKDGAPQETRIAHHRRNRLGARKRRRRDAARVRIRGPQGRPRSNRRPGWRFRVEPICAAVAKSSTRRRTCPRFVRERRSTRNRGAAGQLSQRTADRFKLRQDVFLAEIVLDPFYANYRIARAARKYRPISRFPAIERDFALVLADGTAFAAVRETISGLGIAEIASIEAVDIYRGKNVPAGKFSLLVRVTFQSQDATLTEAQVNDFSVKILAALEQKLGAALRTS